MCDMYGHCVVDVSSGAILRNYLRWNSHGEIDGLKGPMYRSRHVPLRVIAPGVFARPPEEWPHADKIEDILPRCMSAGIDPVDGRIYCKEDVAEILDLSREYKRRIRATWDYEIPTVEKMCEWFDAHFCKRNDDEDWLKRSPFLLSPIRALPFLKGKPTRRFIQEECAAFTSYIVTKEFSATQLLDAFRAHPNGYWEASKRENRRDAAARVLEAAGLN